MKNRKIWYYTSHANIIISCMFIIFYFIDKVNPAMDFMGSTVSKTLLFIFCLDVLAASILNARYLFLLRKREESQSSRRAPRQSAPRSRADGAYHPRPAPARIPEATRGDYAPRTLYNAQADEERPHARRYSDDSHAYGDSRRYENDRRYENSRFGR